MADKETGKQDPAVKEAIPLKYAEAPPPDPTTGLPPDDPDNAD